MHFYKLISGLAFTTVLCTVATPLFAKDFLPIEHGKYVQSRHDCNDPKGSMLFIYDGESVKSGKTSCEISNVTQSGNVYKFEERCSYYHRSWSILPTTVNDFKTTVQVLAKREFVLKRENENLEFNDQYRWCAPE
ncbi:hypothetical protein [Agrobacterium sp.]|uniref:hypothetical protein n=1 Tax=Agrobacterium sp. TaxID=361 RepID=UPI0028B10CEA|nr:hypothetical protein [Agrobacterium sp.]